MTVSTQVSRNEYTGNGATTQYDFTFRILDKSHLLVQTLDTSENIVTLTLGTDYTVTGVNRYNGGKVVLTSALPAGYKISIERSTPVTQEASIRNQGGFFPEIHEDAFDKLTMLVQQAYGWWSGLSLRKPSWLANYYDALNNRIRNLRDPSQAQDAATKGYADNLYQGAISHSDNNFKRTLRVPESEVGMLPGISGRRKKILAFNDTGNPIAVLPESGSAADVMIELAAGDGASHIGGLNYVTPEMSGFVTGAGNADADTAAIQWALNQNAKQVVLDSTKTYNIQPGVIRYTGKINVDAGTAKIVCDGVAVDIIDGAGSVWRGGNLISKTIPWAVIYNDDWTIKEQGRLGYGRMPFQDATGIAPEYIYQDICCAIVFRSSDATAQDGLTVTGVRGSYASVIAAGFINTLFDDCVIRGGCNMGVISIINHTRDKVMFGYVYETSATNLNDFKWARGKNHTITNCTLFEGRAMGLNITGTDGIYVSGCNFIDNAESGVKFGQYTVRDWTDTDICSTNINVTDCLGAGQWYDGFDMQNAYGSGSTTYLDQHLTATNCRGIGNRRTGIVGQGGYNRFISCHTERNGSHGLIAKEGRQQLVDKCVSVGNGLVTGGVDLTVIGIGSIMQNCQAGNVVSDAHQTYMINHQIGAQAGELYAGNYGKNVNNLVYNSSKVNLDPLVDVTRTLKATATDQVSELRGQKRGTLSLRPVARYVRGGRVDSEAGAMAAWEHPYSGAYLRFYTDDMSQLSSSPFVMSYNHGKNAANPNGYADNAGIGGLKVSYYPTSFRIDVYAAGAPTTPAGGASVGAGGISPTIDNQSALGATSLRWTQLYAANSTINTSDANHKTVPVNPSEAEMAAFYEIASLPWAWQWLEKYQIEGDEARLHSGPTVQAAIEVMGKHGLNWTDYSAFCYDSWLEETDSDGNIIPAGGVYSFRKEELLLWMLRATVERQKSIEARLSALESN
ncbi:phage tail fiber protein [Klebsiella pneumoniae]|nr:phage tail fiber protein [Klebsiella pneumoniae]